MGKALSTLPGYKQVYLDDQAMILVRETSDTTGGLSP
jgi:hypothetical protein